MNSVGILLLAVLVLTILGVVVSIFRDIFSYIISEVTYQIKKRQPLAVAHKRILNKYSAYYKLLSAEKKLQFEQRVQGFLYAKRFISRGVGPVTDEMRVLISASAIQLTFGLAEVYLANFDKILVYPDYYYSHVTKKYHLGEVNPRAGIIIISWKSFIDGYTNPRDSFNVGIHEMAHAIHFENRIKNEEFDFLDVELMDKLGLPQIAQNRC